jgi:hypothetical protein
MRVPDKIDTADVETLRNGGQAGMSLFLEATQRLHEMGLGEGLRNWVAVAGPLLPERERAEVIVLLMYGFLFMNYKGPEGVIFSGN